MNMVDPALQKLLFSGRVLADSVTLGEAGIKQGDFLGVMNAAAERQKKKGKKALYTITRVGLSSSDSE